MKEIYFDETFCFWRNFLQLCLAHRIYINPENNKVNFKLTWSLSAISFAINKNNKLFELKFIRNQLELMTFLKKVCYQNITHIDFALNIVYQCQEERYKRQCSLNQPIQPARPKRLWQTQSFRTKNIKREMATKVSKGPHHLSFEWKWLESSSKCCKHVRF